MLPRNIVRELRRARGSQVSQDDREVIEIDASNESESNVPQLMPAADIDNGAMAQAPINHPLVDNMDFDHEESSHPDQTVIGGELFQVEEAKHEDN